MPYQNLATLALSVPYPVIQEARPRVSLPPEGADLSSIGFAFYAAAAQPFVAWSQRVEEAPPINGLQVWRVVNRTGADLAAADAAWRQASLADNDAEAARRISALFGSPASFNRLVVKQLTASARATELADKRIDGPLLPAELAEHTELRTVNVKIKAIRVAEKARAAEISATGSATTAWPV